MSNGLSVNDIDLTHVAELGDALFPAFNTLRETDPIHWNEAGQTWLVTRHQDILDGFSGRVPLSSVSWEAGLASPEALSWAARVPTLLKYAPYHITNTDPPRHTRLRRLLMRAFGRNVVEGLRPFAQQRIAELLELLDNGREVEFNEDIGRALPGAVILELLNLPRELFPKLGQWATDVMLGLGIPRPEPEWVSAADRAFEEMTEHFMVQIADRRANPRGPDDFVTALVQARDGEDALSDDEISAVLQQATIGGHDTTGNSMTFALVALARQPELWRHLQEHPEAMLDSLLELMRYTAMSAAQRRVVGADFEWHGKQLKKGQFVMLMVGIGNRDPRVFSDPDTIDLSRSTDQSLTFGPGLHHCIGHLLAKMQLTEFFTSLTQRFDGVDILDEELHYSPILVFRTIPELHVRFHPRPQPSA